MKSKAIIFLFSILIGFTTHINAQENQGFTIKGQLKGLPNGTKIYLTTQEKDTVARTISTGNHFVFKGKLPLNGRFHFIKMDTLVSKIVTKAIFVVNNAITVSGTVGQRDLIVTGSAAHNDYTNFLNEDAHYDNRIFEIGSTVTTFAEKANAAYKAGDSIVGNNLRHQQDNSFKKIDSVTQIQNKNGIKWIKDHPASLCLPYILLAYINVLGNEETQKVYDGLTPEVKASYYGVELKNLLENNKLSAKIQENKIIPNFDINGVNGASIRIHELAAKNKLTLIDFWASWCSPCRAAIPELKKLYETYKGKGFSIVGVSTDKNEAAWKKAVIEDGTPWLHGLDKNKASAQLFDMKAIPAYILIDNKGKMIAFDCALSNIPNFGGSLHGEALEKKIEELLNNRK